MWDEDSICSNSAIPYKAISRTICLRTANLPIVQQSTINFSRLAVTNSTNQGLLDILEVCDKKYFRRCLKEGQNNLRYVQLNIQ